MEIMKNQDAENMLRITGVENAIDSLEKACKFSSSEDPFMWKWIALALHDALYTVALSCIAFEPSFVVEAKNRDVGFFVSPNGNPNDWRISEKSVVEVEGVNKGRCPYRIRWRKLSLKEVQAKGKAAKKKKGRSKERLNILEWMRENEKAKVIGFWSAIARVQDDVYWMKYFCITEALVLSDDKLRELWYLQSIVRNNLIHCRPGFHEFDVERIRSSCLVAVRAISFLLDQSLSAVHFQMSNEQREVSGKHLAELGEFLQGRVKS